MYVACLKDILNKAYVGKKFFGSNLNYAFDSYRYLRHPPVIKEVSLRCDDSGDMNLTLEFEDDEYGNKILPFHADLYEEIKLED